MQGLKRYIKYRLFTGLGRLRAKCLGNFGVAILCDTPQGIFAVAPEDLGVGHLLLKNGCYDASEIAAIKGGIPPEDSILIVGTHIGAVLVPLAKHAALVYGVEANPDSYNLLQLNITLNNLTNVITAPIAASDKTETLTFLKNTTNSGGSKRMPKSHNDLYFYDNPSKVEVPAHALDDYIDRTFDHVIMDIEGSEVFALRGMPRILEAAASLRVEFIPHHLRDVAGVDTREFLEPIEPYFDELCISSKDLTVRKDRFFEELDRMFQNGEEDSLIVFRKTRAS